MEMLLPAILGCSILLASADVVQKHPLLSELVGSADEIVVARQRLPQMWTTSELVVFTGLAEADITKSVKGTAGSGCRLRFRIVRIFEAEPEPIQEAAIPSESIQFPRTPDVPSEFKDTGEVKIPVKAPEEILFLRRNQDGSLSAIDGFVYALPYSVDLERAIRAVQKFQAQQGAGQPATRSELGSEGEDKPQPESEGRSR